MVPRLRQGGYPFDRRRRPLRAPTMGLGAVLLAVALLRPLGVGAQAPDPHLDWHTIRTRHFEIHYHAPLGMLARRVATVAERAHENLTPLLGHRPQQRTQVVLTDHTDSANGSATALPRNEVRLFASAPGDLSALSDHDDWLTTLVTHEHSHILHLDNWGGVPAIINAIFGKVYAPNHILPRWFIEGLATYQESAQTSGGRMRSTMFEMFIRMDALQDRLLSIDQLSNSVDRWPHGNVWYLYGSRFVGFITDRYGDDAIGRMAGDYGDETLPYGLNRASQRVTGKSFVDLYDEFLEHQRRHQRAVAEEVRRRGLMRGQRLTRHGENARSPRFVDDDTIVYYVDDGRSLAQLRSIGASDGDGGRRLVRVRGEGYLAPHPDGRHVYYNSVDAHRDIYNLYDLFRYDRQSGESTRLTRGLRAREPDVSPDGRRIAFTINGAGTRHLAISQIDDIEGSMRLLVRSRRYEQVYTPRFSPDGRTIAFSAWKHGGYRDIHLVDVETGETRAVTDDRAFDTGPAWSPDGRWLFFSSDRTGIANIYAWSVETGELRQVTNVVAGAYHPAISPDGETLVYLGYTSWGFDLYRMALEPDAFRPAPAYVDDRPAPSDADGVAELRSEPYNPLPTLPPQAWMLDYSPGALGQRLAIEFDGRDVVGWHSYTGRVVVPFDHRHVNAALRWRYARYPVPVSLRLFRRVTPRGGLRVGGERRRWLEDAIGGEVALSYRFPRSFHSETVSLGYSVSHLGKARPFGGELDPNDPPPQLPETGLLASARVGWSYSDVVRRRYDISPSWGRRIALSLSAADPLIGSQLRSVTARWSVQQYIENPFLPLHVLAVRYAGGINGGGLRQRGAFAVGGFPDVSLLDDLIDRRLLGGVALRGYPPFSRSGNQFHLLQTEYRFPIIRPQIGPQTLPTYVNRVYGSVFADYGDAFFDELDFDSFRFGLGGEIFVDFTIGYVVGFTLRTGIAWGFHEQGGLQYYANLGIPF